MSKFFCQNCGSKMLPQKEIQDIEYDKDEPWGVRNEYVCYLECGKCGAKVEVGLA